MILAASACVAQTPALDRPTHTFGQANGRMWQSFNSGEKLVYVLAVTDTLLSATPSDLRDYIPKTLNFGEVVSAVDLFYQEPENMPISILQAMRVVTLKANGASPAVIEETKATIRKLITDAKK